MLPGNEPEPSREITSAFEDAHRWSECFDRHRRDRPHARHGLQAATHRAACGFVGRGLLEFGNLLRQLFDLFEEDAGQLHNKKRKRCRCLFDCLRDNLYGTTMPCSDKWPRSALISCVRWRTRRSRVRNNIARACCSSVFIATKRMVGRLAASQIASASAASFFWRLTNGLT